ncbi:hypothetical protein Mkiyose1665_05120 [Mycobacterium kiyosense]|nr:hypothetical protein IWGMT90018_31320 [Mycobacterium kiyosense]BDE14061.1 hypothetical protein MKCMC460_29210 [Mycobacterium sp. 20KCMC460]GLB88213.1 hypothetical protein SRL2020130_10300 [Mycobacterium kiyosense]GLB94519.1 hypothetical protein SRL2020226_12950 [Mycobacterium kiyosense]GLB99943.1 hypothetical protein SRL2020400_05350 [Mycobacterium kiyosense]
MGANPAASQGSVLAAPDVMRMIGAILKRDRVIVIDPVRTQTAAHANSPAPVAHQARGPKEVLGQVPVPCMVEEIATRAEGQLRALITIVGNPVRVLTWT